MTQQETILIADDAEINRAVLRSLFEKNYNILEAENGEQALMLLHQYRESISAILLDLVMPRKDGYEVLEEINRAGMLYYAPVVVITADDSVDNRVRVFELGASDIIAKPFEPEVVKSRIKNIIELGRYRQKLEALVEEQSVRAREANAAVIDMLSSVIEYRSLESGQHIRRIRMFTRILLEDVAENYTEYALDGRKISLITDASSMHDIGKIAIPDSILNKPGRLTEEEFEVMKTHTLKGCEILSGLDRLQDREYLQYAYQICRYHHERWDGKGYPDGLKGDSIPLCAQVVAIADCYDALTTDRVYKKAIQPSQAFSMILNGECGTFSLRLLECFKNVRDTFAQLSKQYADGLSVDYHGEVQPAADSPIWESGESTLEQSQQKYYALLRYLDSTVMEVDLSSGVYHLVYLADQDFSALRSGSSFEESIRNFAETAVHPDDRQEMLKLLGGYIQELFDEGMTWRERRYRVLDCKEGEYVWVRASLLRTNLENPRLRRALLVWHKEEAAIGQEKPVTPERSKAQQDREISNPVVEQLFGGIRKCFCDRNFTLIKNSRSLTTLLGYSSQEIQEQFQNQFMMLIYPADREKVLQKFYEQRNEGRLLELEYRLMARDGRLIWVLDRLMIVEEDGNEVAYGTLMDITKARKAEDELRLSLERHSIIMDQTNDIIFEWDIITDKLYLSSNWEKQYGYAPITENVRIEIPRASHIHPDDMTVFVQLMDAVAAGVPYKETEFRIADEKGRYRWCKVRATAQFDLDGKPSKAVGVILDIDTQKREAAALQERAARDALTGLYNKTAARARAETSLSLCEAESLSALMILDVDNFKQINNQYGHMFGDAVLVEISARISSLFRGADTIARIGGDEFMIFMPDVHKEDIAVRRAKEMIQTLKDMLKESVEDTCLSCSIGVAFTKGRKTEFQLLFDHADLALYRAKAEGKNQYVCYTDQMSESHVNVRLENTAGQRTEIDSDLSRQWDQNSLITQVFDILYDAPDFTQALQSILELTGKMFEISRIYIFENDRDDLHCSNTFEWCAEGVEPQIQNLQRIPYTEGEHDYRDNFGGDGLFYCQNIKKLGGWERSLLEGQRIMSTLQYAIREKGLFHGFVGFDDCKIRRLWTRDQVNALTFLGRLLSVFLLKNRAQEALSESLANLHGVLDNQEMWLYVLDPGTYTLRYINEKTKELVPEAEIGRPCYEVFYHRDRPCEPCVMERAKESGQITMELYNPYLDIWVLADASIVEWNKRKACLVGCRNISSYKQKNRTPKNVRE